MLQTVKKTIASLYNDEKLSGGEFRQGHLLYLNGQCQLLSQSQTMYDFSVYTDDRDCDISIVFEDESIFPKNGKKVSGWDSFSIAALLQLSDELSYGLDSPEISGRKYSKKGMIKRVLAERRERAANADYQIHFADNLYGEHTLINEKGVEYKITLRDFENETGYIDNIDLKTNKLGTTKHIIYAFHQLKSNPRLMKKMDKTYPFVEVFLDPLNDYKITWFYPHHLGDRTKRLIDKYFAGSNVYPEKDIKKFLDFIMEAGQFGHIKIRPEVIEKVEKEFAKKSLEELRSKVEIDFSDIKAELYPYQKEGIKFSVFREGAIIADEMGLGKTIQAIASAILKKKIFGFKKTLVICPASIKSQWKREIEKFTTEQGTVVQGFPKERENTYKSWPTHFLICNYESILRDADIINKYQPDLIILDEAQRIKNYETKTSYAIKSLSKKHSLVITGTPIENRLTDLYSIVGFIDPLYLSPLWEFSYKHCFFDENARNKITGYYNLNTLKKRLKPILIRREKANVIEQINELHEQDITIRMTTTQSDFHSSYARAIAGIINKKFITPYDMQRLMLLMAKMRMVCDSSYLVDENTNDSPKLIELKHILLEKIDIRNSGRKIIIFSEWRKMTSLIAKMLKKMNIKFVELSGRVPVKHRGKLIKKFEDDKDCKIFLSTEAGGVGLNLQVADTVINFELPWNPAKKNQRIGRIDRLGQKNSRLNVINLITKDSIEERIAAGLIVKKELFDGTLNSDKSIDTVDFSEKGRSQFLKQLEQALIGLEDKIEDEETDYADSKEEKDDDNILSLYDGFDEQPGGEGSVAQPEEKSEAGTIDDDDIEPEAEKFKEMEDVMNHGLDFLSGLYKMSTGKEIKKSDQKIEIDRQTGEVVMRFKLPG